MRVRVDESVSESVAHCAMPATKSAPRGSQSAGGAERCACHEICTLRFTKCCAWHEICKRATCPKVTIHCTCQEIGAPRRSPPCSKCCACHEICIYKAAPIPCACHEKSTLDHQSTRFPLCLPRKVTTRSENARGTTRRVQSRQAPPAPGQILRACAVERHFEDFERHECPVNSSELAGHVGATPRI